MPSLKPIRWSNSASDTIPASELIRPASESVWILLSWWKVKAARATHCVLTAGASKDGAMVYYHAISRLPRKPFF